MPQTVRSRRGGKGLHPKGEPAVQLSDMKSRKLPEYLEAADINALIQAAPNERVRLFLLLGWRAGLRVSEIGALRASDIHLDGDKPTLKVRQGKGRRDRIVPVQSELATALRAALEFWRLPKNEPLLGMHRTTAHTWIKDVYQAAVEYGTIAGGKRVFPHILRHSAARHWIAAGVPINHIQRWLGHANLATTMIYLELVPDSQGFMENVS